MLLIVPLKANDLFNTGTAMAIVRPMTPSPDELWRVLGKAARIWAASDLLDVQEESWTAFSGQRSVSYNLACCHSSEPGVLTEHCLEPTLAQKKPAVIMLAGPGLAAAQRLVEPGWVTVGALPLMTLRKENWSAARTSDSGSAKALSLEELPAARELLAESYGLDRATAVIAIPDQAVDASDMSVWGCYAEGHLASSVTTVLQDGLVVIWSMATRRECQGRGYGRRLLDALFAQQFEAGASGSLLHSSMAGEKLYRQIGFTVVEYLQLWSRPRWVLGAA
jgi:ribosomal protein S18 acetylase RimI-like enzyme